MRWASALVWPWLVTGSVPLEDSMRMSAKTMPVEMWTEATLEMAMLSSLLPNQRDFTRLTRCELTTSLVGKRKLPLVQRLAVKVSVWGVGVVDIQLWYAGGRVFQQLRLGWKTGERPVRTKSFGAWVAGPHVYHFFQSSIAASMKTSQLALGQQVEKLSLTR